MTERSELAVRRAGPADAKAVSELASETFPLACPDDIPSADLLEYVARELNPERFAELLVATGVVTYVAEKTQSENAQGEKTRRMTGYAMLVAGSQPPVALPARRPVELKRIYVRETEHGAGAAQVLMETCDRHARTHGYDLMWLGTSHRNQRALKFYHRMGFEEVGTREFHVGDTTEKDYVLALKLEHPAAGHGA